MNADHPCPPFVDGDVQPVPLDEAQFFSAVCAGVKELLPARRQPSAGELLEELTKRLGWRVRTVLIPAIQELREDQELPQYFRSYLSDTLSDEELSDALRGDLPQERDYQSTLDDLLQRSKMFRNSAAFREAVEFVARFRDYAPYNNFLVKLQNPGCDFYATERDWRRRFGREVKPSVPPMLILAPMHPVMLVYDLDSTEGRPLPEKFEKFAKVEGSFDSSVLNHTIENAERIGVRVEHKQLSSTQGGYAERFAFPGFPVVVCVVVNEQLDDASAYSVLCHELAHILLGHLGSSSEEPWPSRINLPHATVEIEAEAVSYIVCERCGLRSESAAYLSSYMTGDEIPKTVSLELITKVAGKLEQWGKRLFKSKKPQDEESPVLHPETPGEPISKPKSKTEAAADALAELF